jgi:hypothetical protein
VHRFDWPFPGLIGNFPPGACPPGDFVCLDLDLPFAIFLSSLHSFLVFGDAVLIESLRAVPKIMGTSLLVSHDSSAYNCK